MRSAIARHLVRLTFGRGDRMLMLEALIEQLMNSGAAFVAMEDAVAEYRERWPAGRSWGA